MRIVQFYAIIILSNVRCEGYKVVADVQREEFIMLRRKKLAFGNSDTLII